MATRPRLALVARLAGAALILASVLPSAALAAPSPESCAAYRAVTYSASVPQGLRAEGTKLVQWRSVFTDAATGELVVDDGIFNEVTFDADAPLYPNDVLIRLFRSTTILAGGEVITVDAIDPAQPARMHVNVSWEPGGRFYTGDMEISFRYEIRNNRWSEWYATTMGPEQSFCTENTRAIWKKGVGWQES
jgi:hypothetical protein